MNAIRLGPRIVPGGEGEIKKKHCLAGKWCFKRNGG